MTALAVNTRKLAELRASTSDSTLPAYAWPGAYQLVYYTTDGLTICPNCANDPDTSDPVADADVYWEGPPIVCDDKGETIESAYGDDPDAPEPCVVCGAPVVDQAGHDTGCMAVSS